MKRMAQILSGLALAGTLLSAGLVFAQKLDLVAAQHWMLGLAALWFMATPWWMERY
jgi:hypothetical protein